VEVTTKKIDDANVLVTAKIAKSDLEEKITKLAKEAGKQLKVDGFRKGKVPLAVVKKMYAESIVKEAIDELIKEEYEAGLKELNISQDDIIGEPIFTKFEKGDEKTKIHIKLSLKPKVEIEGYEDVIPEVKLPKISKKEIEEKIAEYAKNSAEPTKSDKETVENGDIAVIDFEGFIDGKEMENGAADNYPLEIGSNSFIPGFEEQIIGMKVGEEKEVKVTFPEEYQAKEIAGKEATFKVKLKEIQEKKVPEIDDELAKKLLQMEDATVKTLKDEIKKELIAVKKTEIYQPKKEELVEKLVAKVNLIKEHLDEAGIKSIVLNEKASEFPVGEIELYVEVPDVEKAEKIISEYNI